MRYSKYRNIMLIGSMVMFVGSVVIANVEIQTDLTNAVQTIKQIFITSDGTEGGSTRIKLNPNNEGGIHAYKYCDENGNNCVKTETIFTSEGSTLGDNYIPKRSDINSGLVDSIISEGGNMITIGGDLKANTINLLEYGGTLPDCTTSNSGQIVYKGCFLGCNGTTWVGMGGCTQNQIKICDPKVLNSVWVTASTYNQTRSWDSDSQTWSTWSPIYTTEYYTVDATNDPCEYNCAPGYRWDTNTNSCIDICILNGVTYHDGDTVTMYSSTSVVCTDTCASNSEIRTCDGELGTFDGTYTNVSCSETDNTQACSIPNGVGEQTCNAGDTSWSSCTVISCDPGYRISGNSCIDTCILNGVTYHDGDTVTMYYASSIACIDTCASNSEIRTCDGESGNFDGTYSNVSCSETSNTQSCTVSYGGGEKACDGGDTSWGSCTVTWCTTDYYDNGGANDCVWVGNGYYSNSTETARHACTNLPSDTSSRDYYYTSDGDGSPTGCTYTYNDLCGIDLYESTNGTCSAVGNGYYSPSANNTRYSCTGLPTNAYWISDGNGSNSCDWQCNNDYFDRYNGEVRKSAGATNCDGWCGNGTLDYGETCDYSQANGDISASNCNSTCDGTISWSCADYYYQGDCDPVDAFEYCGPSGAEQVDCERDIYDNRCDLYNSVSRTRCSIN